MKKISIHKNLVDILSFFLPIIGIIYLFKKARFNKPWLIITACTLVITGLFTYLDLFKNLN